ncbi:MAG: hypothetical protein V1775_18290 [Bacteroidota bacterium]
MENAVVKIVAEDDSLLGLSVRAYSKEAAIFCSDLHAVRRYIENSIGMMNPKNHVTPSDAYRVAFSEDYKAVEVWHYNVKGDKDRLLLTVKER